MTNNKCATWIVIQNHLPFGCSLVLITPEQLSSLSVVLVKVSELQHEPSALLTVINLTPCDDLDCVSVH